uniref:Putative hsp27-ere-tata-binding protein/scaffold attachment factor saf-b n=1 Tax=Xenopsylla cheopis TaxID=163159 RepID=A0A6M2DS78_XENCH
MASDGNFRNLNDLRVSDLREELEKRGLDKSGVKSVLVKRLQQVLSEERGNSNKTTMEKPDTASGEVEEENVSQDFDPEDVDPNDMVVKDELDASIDENETNEIEKEENGDENDEAAEEGEIEPEQEENEDKEEEEKAADNHYELKQLAVKVEDCASKIRPGPACSKISKAALSKPKPACNNVGNKPENQEQEDSINLTIGEDEEKLLQEADDSQPRSKTDVKRPPKSTANIVKKEQASAKVERSLAKEENKDVQSADVPIKEECEENTLETEKKSEEETMESKNTATEATSTSTSPSKSAGKEDKDSTKKSSTSTSRNLWVSGLASSTRATDLKQVFSKYGKVIGAKVVTSARTPGARCYGYVTMATNEDATKCIHNLHRTELHGRMVSVERAKSDNAVPSKKEAAKSEAEHGKADGDKISMSENKSADASATNGTSASVEGSKDQDKSAEGDSEKKLRSEGKSDKDKERSSSRKSRSKVSSKSRDRDRSRGHRRFKSNSSKERKMDVLSFEKIRAEREKQRIRDRERALREEERKRRAEQQRNREVERWQREEAARLAKEREKLEREREKIERDRVEILKLERTRQKLERERLELERMELKKQQMKIEEARIAAKRSALDRREPYPPGHDDRKRPTLGERRIEAPPPPRFDQVSSGVGGPSQSRSGAGNYGDSGDLMTSKKRDYGGKRDEIRKNDIRGGAGGDFKRGSDFDIVPRHSGGGGHMMHPSHSSHQANLIKYPGQSYDDRGRDNSELGSRQDSSGGPLQSSRSKDSSRYADRSGDRPSERGSGMSYRGGGDRDNGRRPVESTDHRSSSGSKMAVRGSSRERRYGDGGIKDSGRYSDRPNSSWHGGGGSSSSKPYGGGMNSSGSMNSNQNMVSNNPWANDSRSKPSQNQSSAWHQVDNPSSNDRWSRSGLYPPGVSPNSLMGSSNSYGDHRYGMTSMRKY